MPGGLIDEAAAWDSNADPWTVDVQAGPYLYRRLYNLPAFPDFFPATRPGPCSTPGCGAPAQIPAASPDWAPALPASTFRRA